MGNHIQTLSDRVNLIANSDTWIEGKAIQQLEKTAELPGIVKAAGMPDLHPGRGYPIGASFMSQGKIYPALVGNDIGCGMALWSTSLKTKGVNLDKFEKRLTNIDSPLTEDWGAYINQQSSQLNLKNNAFERSLGTIGGGNHFAELQQVSDIYEPAVLESLSLNKKQLVLLIHSGSRGLGESILRNHVDQFGHRGLGVGTDEFNDYLEQHQQALIYAQLNRQLIALRILEKLRSKGEKILYINHNFVSPVTINKQDYWIHRKGAAPSDCDVAIIPGSRGDYSYLVKPKANLQSLYSLAHGAGRKWMRSECKDRLSKRYKKSDLERTNFGSRVICKNKDLLYEEAPEAYKSISTVIEALQSADLILPIARFNPVLTYKTKGECR